MRVRRRAGVLLGCAALLLTACSAGVSTTAPSSRSPSPAPLPPVEDVRTIGAHAIASRPAPDWVEDSPQGVWVANVGDGLVRYDDGGRRTASVALDGDVVLGMERGFGALWVADQDDAGRVELVRVDLDRPTQVRRTTIGAGSPTAESSIAVAAGRVWLLADRGWDKDLVAVDPVTLRATTVRSLPATQLDPGALRGGFGALWLTDPNGGTLWRLDPADGGTTAKVRVGDGPRFLAVGPDAVWVMNQSDGSVSRVDPGTDRVTATTRVTGAEIDGGDIVATPHAVWVRTSGELASLLDPATTRVVRRVGPEAGSGSIAVHGDDLWISAHDVSRVWRIPDAAEPS